MRNGNFVTTNRYTNFNQLDDKVTQYAGRKIDMWNPNNTVEDDGEKALWEALKSAGILKEDNGGNNYLFDGQSYDKFMLEFEKIVEKDTYTHNIYIFEVDSQQSKWIVSYISNYDPYGDSDYTYQLLVAEWEKYGAYQWMKGSTASELKEVVATWYFNLRNIALLVLMLILIYSGIRIVIGSTAGEKAKYKERIIDWIVAMCLVIIMHYIMVFAVELVERITELVRESTGENINVSIIPISDDKKESIESYDMGGYKLSNFIDNIDGIDCLVWPTDLMGQMRIEAQLVNEGTARWAGYSICFIVLVFCTMFFAWTYLKRVIYMAFLTIIAPLVAMTYPIDKITDGKAQAFNMWLREYIFNLMIQPLHLLLYTVLVSSAFELATQHALYAIVAIGFMMPAEKLLRRFFGFEKAKTPGLLGGAAGAALTMTGLQSIMKIHPNGHRDPGERQDYDEGKNDIRYSSSQAVSPMENITSDIRINQKPEGDSVTTETIQKDDEQVMPGSLTVNTINGRSSLGNSSTSTSADISKRVTNRKKVNPRGALKSVGATIGSYSRAMGNKAWKRIKKGRPIRALASGALGLVGAGTLGTLGLALGIASGDASKAFQYTTASVAGGFVLGKGVGGAVVDTLSVNGNAIRDDVELEWYGDDYKKVKLEQQKREFIKDENNLNYLRKTLGVTRQEAKRILENFGSTCIDSGITKIEDVAAIRELTETQGVSVADAITLKKFSNRLPTDINKMSASKIEGHRKQFQKEIEDKLRPKVKAELVEKIRGEQIEQIRADIIKQLMDKQEDVTSKEAHDRIEKLTSEEIDKRAELVISREAEARSKEIISGIISFADAKDSLIQG